jgi:transcriptional regulator with XRE-family HTH domain
MVMAKRSGQGTGHQTPVLHPYAFREWRQEKVQLPQFKLAESFGLGQATVRKWENFDRVITAPGMVGYAARALQLGLKPADLDVIKVSELRQRRIDHVNRKADKNKETGPGRIISLADRAKTNLIPGVNPETGCVEIDEEADRDVIDPDSFVRWRKSHKLTLQAVADRFLVSVTSVKKWAIAERAMPSPRMVKLACAAIDAGLLPAFSEADFTTVDEIEKLRAEYEEEYKAAQKKGGFALMRFYDKKFGTRTEKELEMAFDGPDEGPDYGSTELTGGQLLDHLHEQEMYEMRRAALEEDGPLPEFESSLDEVQSSRNAQESILDLDFISRRIAEAVHGLDVHDSQRAIRQILEGIPPEEIRKSIRSHNRRAAR